MVRREGGIESGEKTVQSLEGEKEPNSRDQVWASSKQVHMRSKLRKLKVSALELLEPRAGLTPPAPTQVARDWRHSVTCTGSLSRT